MLVSCCVLSVLPKSYPIKAYIIPRFRRLHYELVVNKSKRQGHTLEHPLSNLCERLRRLIPSFSTCFLGTYWQVSRYLTTKYPPSVLNNLKATSRINQNSVKGPGISGEFVEVYTVTFDAWLDLKNEQDLSDETTHQTARQHRMLTLRKCGI